MSHSQKRRLWSETITIELKVADGQHVFDVSLVFDGPEPYEHDSARIHEIVFVGRGKVGGGLDQMLIDLGVQLSRAIQGRYPSTGELVH